MNILTIPAERDRLDQVQAFIDQNLAGVEYSPEAQIQLQIAVEELFVNIASYAYAPGHGDVGGALGGDPQRELAAERVRQHLIKERCGVHLRSAAFFI